jgi:hypothetical protein
LQRKRRDIVRVEPKTKFVVFGKPTHKKKTLSTTHEELERRRRRKREPKKRGRGR